MRMTGKQITGWVLSILVFLMLSVLSASGKFRDFPGKEEMFNKLGWDAATMFWVGVVEVSIAVLFLIPRTSLFGAILITAYLGGATAAHVRIHDNFVFPIIFGILTWIALGLRDHRVFSLAFSPLGEKPISTNAPGT